MVLAFMDIFPVSKGHCLIIPKKHYENMLDVDLKIIAHLSKKLAELTRKVNNAFNPDGILNVVANGSGAGQEVPHLHFHIIPRTKGSQFGFRYPDNYRDSMAPIEELEEQAKRIVES